MNLKKTLLIAGASLSLVATGCFNQPAKPDAQRCASIELYSGGQLVKKFDNVIIPRYVPDRNLRVAYYSNRDPKNTKISFYENNTEDHTWKGEYDLISCK